MDEGFLHNSFILFEIICVMAVFVIFLIRSHFYTEVLEHRPRILTQIIFMVFYGLISIVGTVTGIGLFGSIGNVRDIGPMIAGLTCGPVIGIGAGIIGGLYRFMQGGPYMYTGLSAPIFCGIMGGILYLANNREFVSTRIATLFMALCDTFVSIYTLTLVTPPAQLWTITGNIAIPMILGSTVGVFIFSSVIHSQIREREREQEYKRIEREVADKRNLDSIINTLADPVYLIDQNFHLTLVNEKFCQLIGRVREELLGKPIGDFFSRDEGVAIHSLGTDVFESQSSVEKEMTLTGSDGRQNIVISKNTLYIDSNGQESVVGIIRDISERKKIEVVIRESEARLSSILQGSPMMQFVIDHDHRVISWNKAVEKFSNIPARDIVGTPDHWKMVYETKRPLLADILLDGDLESLPRYYGCNIRASPLIEGAYEGTEFYPDLEPAGKWFYFIAAPVRDYKGEIIGAIETLDDITERKQIESALSLTLKKLNLLSSVTRHDILNKLTILSGSLYIAGEFIQDPEGIEHITRAQKTAGVIRKQIAFTREYEELGIKAPAWQRVSEVVQSAVQEMTDEKISISVGTSSYEVFADPLLHTVFHNLFENARQHGVSVTRITVSEKISDSALVITVSDNGAGITPEDKEHIFEQGYGKNTGFGLFLSSEILAITGITIQETGSPGTGAIFEITVPNGGYRTFE
jgi:PAS domain S-box-containing protein